jgi:uncharacterized protein YggE
MIPHFFRLATFSAASIVLCVAPAWADATVRTISISGTGETKAAPDEALLSAGVTTNAHTAAAALTANTKAMNAVFATLKKVGVADKDMQTSDFSVQPQYSSDKGPQRIIGYQVSNNVSVTVENLSGLGATLDALVSSGANNIGDIAFGFRDPKSLMQKARATAVADAIARAQVIAKAAGVSLGPITSISESGGNYDAPRPMYRAMSAMAASVNPAPVAAGQESLSTSVSITWDIR